MRIDATTLSDLEVLDSGSGPGVLDLIDRTVTKAGRIALEARLKNPNSDVAAIRATQDVVRFFSRQPDLFLFDAESLEAVGRYIQSNIVIESRTDLGARVEKYWLSVSHPDLLRELGDGIESTRRFFTAVAQVCNRIESRHPPTLLREFVARLKEIATTVLAICADGAVLRQDRALRRLTKQQVLEALRITAELDALRSMAIATSELGFAFPDVVEAESFLLDADGIFHPFLSAAVRNPVRLDGGEPMVFLTGPNMAGKTTYLRSVGLIVLLAQTGMGVPAARARISPVEVLFTSLNPKDNLRAGLSYFFAEIMRVKEAATILAEGRRALVIFDEVFKGTNVRDALEASAEVILGFADARESGFIFSSHLIELVDVVRANPAIRFYCFDGDIRNGVAEYGYQLRTGVSEKRLGLALLRQAEIPQLIARIGAWRRAV